MLTPSKSLASDIAALLNFTDLVSDVATGMALLAMGWLLMAQRRAGVFDLPVLIARRELACMLISIASVRLVDVLARASVWLDVLAAGLRLNMAAIAVVVALHAWRRFTALGKGAA